MQEHEGKTKNDQQQEPEPKGESTMQQTRLDDQRSANRRSHNDADIERVGEGQLLWCRRCHSGEAELWERRCIPEPEPARRAATGRALDALVAEKVLGYHVERITPEWAGREVTLFFRPGNPLVEYSMDGRSDNACMYRNGVDDKDGIAPPLPIYSEDIAAAWEVVEHLKSNGWAIRLSNKMVDWAWWAYVYEYGSEHATAEATVQEETAPLAICRAALQAVEATP